MEKSWVNGGERAVGCAFGESKKDKIECLRELQAIYLDIASGRKNALSEHPAILRYCSIVSGQGQPDLGKAINELTYGILSLCDPKRWYGEVMTAKDYYIDGGGFRQDEYEKREVEKVHELIRRLGIRRLIELGMGNGRVCAEAAETFPELRIVGVDFAPSMVDMARLNLSRKGVIARCELVEGDARELELKDYGEGSLAMFAYGGFGNNPLPEHHIAILKNMRNAAQYVWLSVFKAEELERDGMPQYKNVPALFGSPLHAVPVFLVTREGKLNVSSAAISENLPLISHWFHKEYLEWLFKQADLKILEFEEFGRGYMILAERT